MIHVYPQICEPPSILSLSELPNPVSQMLSEPQYNVEVTYGLRLASEVPAVQRWRYRNPRGKAALALSASKVVSLPVCCTSSGIDLVGRIPN